MHAYKVIAQPAEVIDLDAVVVIAPQMRRLYEEARQLAPARLPVLIVGETGVGKEHLSELMYRCSGRDALPFVRINCAAISDNLFESELFGHERGAFTGADRAKPGLLETAGEGTVLLDEIGELPLVVQAKLLRALESRSAARVGGLAERPVGARFIGASNRDLERAVEEGSFRRDLYHRIAGARLWVPPLRQRRIEILPLANTFIRLCCRELRRPVMSLSTAAGQLLLEHSWPGNIRELRNAIEHAVLLAAGGVILPEHFRLGSSVVESTAEPATLESPANQSSAASDALTPSRRPTRELVQSALAAVGGNQTLAAARLGICRRTMSRWLDSLAITRPRKGPARTDQ